jgi:hypothetical protein
MNKWELVVIWDEGDGVTYIYDTEEEAEEAGRGMKMALGNQIKWYGVRKETK